MGKVTRLDDVRRARLVPGALMPGSFPEDRVLRASRYRMRACELRAISDEVMLKETCLTLLSLAKSYEQMARTMERMEARMPAKQD